MNPSPRSRLPADLDAWHPQPITACEVLSTARVACLSAVLDRSVPVARAGEALPPLWHWLYFLDWPLHRDLRPDGHPRHGHFMPPLQGGSRMVAGGRIDIRRPLRLGSPAERTSTLGDVTVKRGGSGEMIFVTVRHEISQDSHVCLVEESQAIYWPAEGSRRRGAHGNAAGQPGGDAAWRLSIRPDPPLLFRFSALTANAHRIHYDEPYTREVEGFAGLVVHGPLLALLMLELVRENVPERRVRSLSYRFRRPVFVGDQVHVLGGPEPGDRARMRVVTDRGGVHANAEVWFA